MARFYVGQRVKLARPLLPENKDWTGTIKFIGSWPKGFLAASGEPLQIDCDCAIVWDQETMTRGQHTSQLEPLTDCYGTTTWDQCVWRPEHMRTEA